MTDEQWERFDRLIQEIESLGPRTVSQIKRIAARKAKDEDVCVSRMVLAYYAIAVDPIRSYEGRCIGNYRLRQLIGEGAMGAVYMGKELSLPYRNMAVKLIHPRYSNRRLRQLFLQQIDRYRHIDHHPYVVPLMAADIYSAPNTGEEIPYYVMPYIQGNMNIKRYVRTQRLTACKKLRLFQSVCAGVHYLHNNGIIHGDLKPSNILVDQEGHPYVIDFGFDVDHMSGHNQRVSTISTPSESEKKMSTYGSVGYRTDIRALGAILGELFDVGSSIKTMASTESSFLMRLQRPGPVRIKKSKPSCIRSSMHSRHRLKQILRKTQHSPTPGNSFQAYKSIDELEKDLDDWIKEIEAGPASIRTAPKKLLILLALGLVIQWVGHLTGSPYAQSGGWLLLHVGVASVLIGLFLWLTIQYIRYLAPLFNRNLAVAYGTGFAASLIGGLIYAFGPPAHTDIAAQLTPVWHIKLIRFMATGLVLPAFYGSILAIGSAKRKDPSFKEAEWRVVAWLLLSLVTCVFIVGCIQLTEHPVLSLFLGDSKQGDVRCEIFILVAYLYTLSLICFANWQMLSSIVSMDRLYNKVPAFLSRFIVSFVTLTLSGALFAAVFWGQGLTPNTNDGAYALLVIGLISVWSLTCYALFTGNHATIRWVESHLAPHFQSKLLWVRMLYRLRNKFTTL